LLDEKSADKYCKEHKRHIRPEHRKQQPHTSLLTRQTGQLEAGEHTRQTLGHTRDLLKMPPRVKHSKQLSTPPVDSQVNYRARKKTKTSNAIPPRHQQSLHRFRSPSLAARQRVNRLAKSIRHKKHSRNKVMPDQAKKKKEPTAHAARRHRKT